MSEFSLSIDGMHCGGCVRRVSQALAAEKDIQVNEVRVGTARLTSDQDPPPVARVLEVLAKAGYAARLNR